MISRTLALAAVFTLVLSASASAAKPGPYSGASVNKEIYYYGDIEPRTDKGTVTFKVKSNAVKKFKLKGQEIMCGATYFEGPGLGGEDRARLRRQGQETYTNPNLGQFEVKIKVSGNGKASGTITPTGLCRGKVTFSAKLS